METKTIAGVDLKEADAGKVVLQFATLGVMDRDGDVIEKGAIGSQPVKVSSYGHDAVMYGAMPVGRGTTKEVGDTAQAEVQLFLETERGRDTLTVLKEFGKDQEWSFGYEVKEWAAPSEEDRQRGVYRILKKLKVFEVSPVMVGAGIGTGTLSAKEAARRAPDGLPPASGDQVTLPLDPPPTEVKAAEDAAAAAEAERLAAETAAAEAAAEAERDAAEQLKAAAELQTTVASEYKRFQRTRDRFRR